MSPAAELMGFEDRRNFVGLLSEMDALADSNQILDEGGSVDTAFDTFINTGKDMADLSFTPLIVQEPMVIDKYSGGFDR